MWENSSGRLLVIILSPQPGEPKWPTNIYASQLNQSIHPRVFPGILWCFLGITAGYYLFDISRQVPKKRRGTLPCLVFSFTVSWSSFSLSSSTLLPSRSTRTLDFWCQMFSCGELKLKSISGDGRFFWLCSSNLCAGSCHHGCCCGQRHHCCVCRQGFQVLSMKCFDCSFVCKKIWITHIFSREENVKEKNKTDWMGRTFLKKLWNCDFCDLLY